MPSASGWQRWASCRGGGDPCFVTDDPLLDTAKADLLTAYNNAFAQTPDTGSRKLGDGDSRSGLLGGDGLDGASPKVSPVVVRLARLESDDQEIRGIACPVFLFGGRGLPTGQSHERFRQRPESCQSVCSKPGVRWQVRPLPFLQCRQPDRAARGQLSQHAGRQRLADQQRQQRRRGRARRSPDRR